MENPYSILKHKLLQKEGSLFLTGFMGSGKSTMGQLLAEKIKLPFYDTDSIIEEQTKLFIPEIFQNLGEAYFRQLEKEALLRAPQGSIIATGGGIIEDPGNHQFLKSGENIVIWLDPEWESLLKRIEQTGRPKVLNSTPQELYQLWQKRLSLYRECASFSYSGNSVTELLNQIARNI